MPKKLWERYAATDYDADDSYCDTSVQLGKLYHVAHVETALRIMNDNVCRAGLIFDTSKLNKQRLLVNWLSPNIWHFGSRYGNVGFAADLKEISEGKRFYWVEVMSSYTPVALRILISDKAHDDLQEYFPERDNGPLRYSKKDRFFYWNPKYTLELMLEEDIPLSEFSEIRMFDHHKNYCCIDAGKCTDLKQPDQLASAKLIAGIAANNLPIHLNFFRKKKGGRYVPSSVLADAGDYIMGRIYLLKEKVDGHIKKDDADAHLYMKSALNFLYRGDLPGFRSFACLFYSQEDFVQTLANLVAEKFQLSSPREFSKAFDD